MSFDLEAGLAARRAAGLYRERRIAQSPQSPLRKFPGGELLTFCSNDYLGLANHPAVGAALVRGAQQWGVGAGASHLLAGHTAAHHALEEELADAVGRPRALLFSTGYMANQGVLGALLDRRSAVYSDQLNHASLIDAARLCQARVSVYRHGDARHLAEQLAADGAPRRLVITDGVFSMDGDLAPLVELATLARQSKAWLMVDDAHGFGVLGPGGAGSVAQAGLDGDAVPVLMGTLGKALGCFGAFVAGSEALIETLIQHARSYIYTTALPPALAEATRAALRLARAESWRREKVQALVARFRAGAGQLGLPLLESTTPIQPLIAGSAQRALAWSAHLERRGLLVPAVRPPTVPEGTARLRIVLTAAHEEAQVDRLLDALAGLPDWA
ncbi:8-amino-7-oxononanoate synthase [Immundisolibacter cernigliae]|uniref:8-amino-7-oxononanoate synthase n=1 Tax=Immundisolibacter cernigliae TaxID=1810504 RepID=A0A1B1YR52_9GAMM|nr:8-amino-7-oxononanoate synthase [Immundisolibacter cernigliae]ANX03233.1 8-amino-7-oxononanoate synthase [Immundisolibacter cernigliae]